MQNSIKALILYVQSAENHSRDAKSRRLPKSRYSRRSWFSCSPIFVCVCVCRTVDVVVAGPSVSTTSAWVGRAIYRPFPYSTTRLTPVPVTQQRHSTYAHTWHDVSTNGVIQAAKGRGQLPPGWRSSRGARNSLNKNVLRLTTRITIQTAGLAFGGTGLCSYCVRGVDGSCAKHFTVESYTVIFTHLCR